VTKLKKRPTFKSEKQEAEFWASHDSTEYVDYAKSRRMVFPRSRLSCITNPPKPPRALLITAILGSGVERDEWSGSEKNGA
jgi:hypothetical protein